MPNLDLHARHLRLLRQVLDHCAPQAEIWAHGSRVTGGGHEGSDLDLVLRNPGRLNEPMRQLQRLRDALSESNLPMMVDILDGARLPESFRHQIERIHVVVRVPLAAAEATVQAKP